MEILGIALLLGFFWLIPRIIAIIIWPFVSLWEEIKYRKNKINHAAEAKKLLVAKCEHGISGALVNTTHCEKCQKKLISSNEKAKEAYKENERLINIDRWNSAEQTRAYDECRKIMYANLEQLSKCSPYQFEERISALYNKMEFSTNLTPKSGDFGKDIIADKDGKKYFIECKQYSNKNKVGRPDIQKLYGAITAEKVEGIFITTSSFTNEAKDYIEQNSIPIKLIDRDKLQIMLTDIYGENYNMSYSFKCSCENILQFEVKSYHDSENQICTQCKNEIKFSLYFEDGDIVERGINNHYGNYNPEEIVIPSFFKKEEMWEWTFKNPEARDNHKIIYRTMSEWREYLRGGNIDNDIIDKMSDEDLTLWIIKYWRNGLPIIK